MIVGCLRGVSVRLYDLCCVPHFLRYPVYVTRGYVLACLRGPVQRPIVVLRLCTGVECADSGVTCCVYFGISWSLFTCVVQTPVCGLPSWHCSSTFRTSMVVYRLRGIAFIPFSPVWLKLHETPSTCAVRTSPKLFYGLFISPEMMMVP